ncbi:flagellar biosynthesis anti-sigma factor FlgM [Herbivorax sp. ANBcel31]|uniref:flagellar biosynthesis anti-sigma factor FlgM n=1 Tax=Herbivorax sp. ANBcel31 TaxID=3069754 RepID=UPI0027B7C1B8|nr:flagellar biosynthesis anti-sigma factor FlgM [Herbivorax sp. ANBcel31]MDQ2085107.1 flagellar biosynthesis anti-sigma factor FlgM [Herbivorax sp. ANBcel31]
MKIRGEIPKVNGVYDSQKNINKADKASKATSKKDVVSISGQAKDFQTAMKALKDVPDIRKDKVERLQNQMESGNYQVSGKDIANSVLKGLTEKKL